MAVQTVLGPARTEVFSATLVPHCSSPGALQSKLLLQRLTQHKYLTLPPPTEHSYKLQHGAVLHRCFNVKHSINSGDGYSRADLFSRDWQQPDEAVKMLHCPICFFCFVFFKGKFLLKLEPIHIINVSLKEKGNFTSNQSIHSFTTYCLQHVHKLFPPSSWLNTNTTPQCWFQTAFFFFFSFCRGMSKSLNDSRAVLDVFALSICITLRHPYLLM